MPPSTASTSRPTASSPSVPVLASGGGAQTLAANYAPMCEEIAIEVTGHLVPEAGHWVGEENPDYFCRMFIEFDTSPEPDSSISSIAG